MEPQFLPVLQAETFTLSTLIIYIVPFFNNNNNNKREREREKKRERERNIQGEKNRVMSKHSTLVP